MKSFDDYKRREGQLACFNEWADFEGLDLRMSGEFEHSNKETHTAYLGFRAGQQSKQAEVDELKREMLNKTNEAYADGQKSMRKMIKNNEDELWKNLNSTLKTIEIQQRFLGDADGANKILTSQASELRKRIDEINDHVEINYDENRDDDSHSYWSGYNQALRELFEILKGDQS